MWKINRRPIRSKITSLSYNVAEFYLNGSWFTLNYHRKRGEDNRLSFRLSRHVNYKDGEK